MSELIWTKFTIDKGRLWVSKRVMETHVPFMPLYMNRAVCFITNWLWQMAWVIGRSKWHTPSKIRWVTDVCFCVKKSIDNLCASDFCFAFVYCPPYTNIPKNNGFNHVNYYRRKVLFRFCASWTMYGKVGQKTIPFWYRNMPIVR